MVLNLIKFFFSFKMFEPHMDDYLDDELDELKQVFEDICKEWERSLARFANGEVSTCHFVNAFALMLFRKSTTGNKTTGASPQEGIQARFLDSKNPALAKRNVLASFTDVLLLPVTIVPRAVGAGVTNVGSGLGAMGTGVVQGISMLNPQRWMGTGESLTRADTGYKSFVDEETLFEVGEDEGEEAAPTEDTEKALEKSLGNAGDEAGWGEVTTSTLLWRRSRHCTPICQRVYRRPARVPQVGGLR